MTQSTKTIPTPAHRQFQRGLKRWLPGISFVLMCVTCLWLSQFQGQRIVLTGEVEAPELVVASPQTGIINAILPDLDENIDPVYSTVSKGQLIVRLDDSSVRQTLDELQTELLSLSRDVNVELARIDSNSEAAEVPIIAASTSLLSAEGQVADQNANELQAWRLGAANIERQLKEVELTRLRLELREADHQHSNLARSGTQGASPQSNSINSELLEQKNVLEMAVAKLNTNLAFDSSARTNGKLLSNIDESGLSVAARSLFRSMRRRCELLQSRLVTVQKSASTLDILSPVDGQIEKTHVRTLQLIETGSPVVSIVPSRETYAIGYAREHSAARPVVGMPVAIRSQSDPSHRFESSIESVGPKVESIPARHRVNPRIEEWGRPVRIPIPEEMAIEPGSSISIELIVGRH